MQEIREVDLKTNSEPKSGSKNLLKFIGLLALFIICISLFLVFKGKDLSFSDLIKITKNRIIGSSISSIGSIKFEPGSHPIFVSYGTGIVCAGNDGLRFYNLQGKLEWSKPLALSKPIIRAAGRYLIVGDEEGKKLWAYHNDNEKWNYTTDGKVLTVSINERGYAGIIFKDNSYKSVVKVFNNNGTEIMDRYCSNYYALDVKISPDNKVIAIGELYTSGVSTSAGIRFIPVGSRSDTGSSEENSIIGMMRFVKEALVVATDKKIMIYNQNGAKSLLNDFSKEKISNVNLNGDKFIVKVQKKAEFLGASSKVEAIDMNGKKIGSFNIKDGVINTDVNGDIIAVNTRDKVIFVRPSGKEISRFKSNKEAKEVKLFKGGSHAAVIYSDSLDIINIF